jgi:hypothetical protein
VCLTSRTEVRLNTKVKLYRAVAEPNAAACCERRGFGNLTQAEDVRVERPRLRFAAGWHRELDMINRQDAHRFAQGERGSVEVALNATHSFVRCG